MNNEAPCGILVVDKPTGMTSHDVVNRVRRLYGTRQVGHTGTLDPLATGVLPVLCGRAVKASEYLTAHDKAYEARFRLGVVSGSGVLLLTDMFGGTPSNLAMSVIGHGNFDVIAGTNLPMLIKLASARNTMSLADCVICAQEAGKKYINVASQLLNGNVK